MTVPPGSVLLLAVLRAVISLGLVAVPGFIAGYVGIANRDFLQRLSRFQVMFLMPSLAFSTFGSRFTVAQFSTMWPLLLLSMLQLTSGWCLSKLILHTRFGDRWLHQSPEAFPTLLQMALTFQNVGVFNFPLVRALCNTEGLFQRDSDQCYADGVLMIFCYHIPWDFTLWTQGYAAMMALQKVKVVPEEAKVVTNGTDDQHLSKFDTRSSWRFQQITFQAAYNLLNPMLCAMILGVFVGLIPLLSEVLFAKGAMLSPCGDALKQLGSVGPVVGMQILGGTLGVSVRQMKDAGSASASMRRPGQGSWVLATIVGKLCIMPALGLTLFAALHQLQKSSPTEISLSSEGVRPENSNLAAAELSVLASMASAVWPTDKLLRATAVMQWSAPSCLNITVLCHRAGLDDGVVQAVALLYLVMYSLTMLSTTFWLLCGLTSF